MPKKAMGAHSSLKPNGCKRCGKCLWAVAFVAAVLFLVLSASILSPALSVNYPFHAECELTWKWKNTSCSAVKNALIDIAKKWHGPNNCAQGGEKCLYDITSISEMEIELTHTTPKQKFVDDLSFKFCDDAAQCDMTSNVMQRIKRAAISSGKIRLSQMQGCVVSGFSKSEVWYAILDYGTNYCNMRNLGDGAGLTSASDFSELVSDDTCTQYSTSDCNKY